MAFIQIMKLIAKFASVNPPVVDCIVVPVFSNQEFPAIFDAEDLAVKNAILAGIEMGDLGSDEGDILWLRLAEGVTAKRVMLVNFGVKPVLSPAGFRKIIKNIAKVAHDSAIEHIALYLEDVELEGNSDYAKALAISESFVYEAYRFSLKDASLNPLSMPEVKMKTIQLMCRHDLSLRTNQQYLDRGHMIAQGVQLTRNLSHLPPNICTPGFLAEIAEELAANQSNLKTEVLDEDKMKSLGMGAYLSVTQGAAEPARLIEIRYLGGQDSANPIVLVGKGITFDSGGLSLKSAKGMETMKYDMCGAASIMGCMLVISLLKLPVNVVGLIAASENMPGSRASRPGDIVTSMSGKTLEIVNTDAEGRLVLCDTLTYAQKFKPELIIDVATLTGACLIALGHHASALFSNCDALARELIDAGTTSGDRCWQMPLWDDYLEELKGVHSDLVNKAGDTAACVKAACFLSEFVDEYQWAHIDVAGVSFYPGKNGGATGRPVNMLMQFILSRVEIPE